MAYFVQILSILGEVLTTIYQTNYRSNDTYNFEYESFYGRIHQRLESWLSSLPTDLTDSPSNLFDTGNAGYTDTHISIHTMYHTTLMKLNRHVRHSQLSPSQINRNINQAASHAQQLLQMMHTLSEVIRGKQIPNCQVTFATPLPGYAITCACDILSARGRDVA